MLPSNFTSALNAVTYFCSRDMWQRVGVVVVFAGPLIMTAGRVLKRIVKSHDDRDGHSAHGGPTPVEPCTTVAPAVRNVKGNWQQKRGHYPVHCTRPCTEHVPHYCGYWAVNFAWTVASCLLRVCIRVWKLRFLSMGICNRALNYLCSSGMSIVFVFLVFTLFHWMK